MDTNSDGSQAGEKINYTFSVTNTGNVMVTSITITDPLIGLIISNNPIVSPSSTICEHYCYRIYILTQADIDAGKVTNSALATGKDT